MSVPAAQPPVGVCGWVTDAPPFRFCGERATIHIVWDLDCSQIALCDKHAEPIGGEWAYLSAHTYRQECSGGQFVFRDDSCVSDFPRAPVSVPGI